MKAYNYGAGLALAAYLMLTLAACSKTDNGSNNSTAVAATQCTMSYDGTYRNQYGQPCSNLSYTCSGYTYNAQTGTYINPANGQQIPASQCGGTNVIPNTGYYGNNYVSGCQQWNAYYPGHYYVPIDLGGGQLICADMAQVQQQMVAYYPQFQYSPYYNNPGMWYQQPPYGYGYDYGYGYGQPYGGYQYGCGSGISLGMSSGGFSGGISLCF